MIRLYLDEGFQAETKVRLPESELRYLKTVRRGQGSIQLFNRQGQVAFGTLKANEFFIESVETVQTPLYPISMAVALPETQIIPSVIRSLSELGIQNLIFFKGERSQKARERLKQIDPRWNRIAIEAARQCGRGCPLTIEIKDWAALEGFAHRWFCDESSGADLGSLRLQPSEKVLIVVGCEGGWTESERQRARDREFIFIHFQTPILRVETAVVCAAFQGVRAYT